MPDQGPIMGAPAGSKSPNPTPHHRVAILASSLVLVAALLSFAISDFYRFDPSELKLLIPLAIAFGLGEKLVFHVEARTEAVSYTPSDIALALGVVFVGPLGLLAARLVGSSLGIALFRRSSAVKWLFNLATFTIESVATYFLFRIVFPSAPEPSPMVFVALASALFLALVLGGLAIAGAISCFEGGFRGRAATELANSPIFHLPGALLAAVVAVSVMVAPWQGLIVGPLVPVVWLVVRSHGALLHRYSDLTSAHQFSRRVGDEADIGDIVASAVAQIAENLRAGSVALRVWDRSGDRTESFVGDGALLDALPMSSDACPTSLGLTEFVRLGSDPKTPVGDLKLALEDDHGVFGFIAIAQRLGVNSGFDTDDGVRLMAMTQQLAIAVRKGQLHAQIQFDATHDRLTGLVNRGYFEAWINESGLVGESAILFMDLDRFKEVNDAFGHHVGDELLCAVARCIESVTPANSLVARFGGDEFAVLVPGLGSAAAQVLAIEIASALDEPFALSQATVAVSSSIGIALAPEHGDDATNLLRNADIAMYDAKKRYARVSTYSEHLEEHDSTRLALMVDLRRAITDDELDVHYQPQIDVATDTVVAAEALVRWHHEIHGNVDPATFVELAEQAGMIEALTDRVLSKAVTAAAEWERRGLNLSVSVNISARSLLDYGLVTMVGHHLEQSQLDPARLTLEITESTMMGDTTRTHRMLRALSDLGVAISVDDFGTGYSSLGSLRHLPVSELKIDRSFIMSMATNHHDAVIVRSTIDLAHNLGLIAVAEGVECDELLAQLAELRCDRVQGYGISRPLCLEQFRRWYHQRNIERGIPERSQPPGFPAESNHVPAAC